MPRRSRLATAPNRGPKIEKSLSKGLKKRGFTFAGSTITYACLQAIGIANDHIID